MNLGSKPEIVLSVLLQKLLYTKASVKEETVIVGLLKQR